MMDPICGYYLDDFCEFFYQQQRKETEWQERERRKEEQYSPATNQVQETRPNPNEIRIFIPNDPPSMTNEGGPPLPTYQSHEFPPPPKYNQHSVVAFLRYLFDLVLWGTLFLGLAYMIYLVGDEFTSTVRS